MTLRTKLAIAMMIAAVLPMTILVGAPLLRAESRTRQEAGRRLEAARRQAQFLIEQFRRETAGRVEQATQELERNPQIRQAVIGGPEQVADEAARTLATRFNLDQVEVHDSAGRILAQSESAGNAGTMSSFSSLVEGAADFAPQPPEEGTGRLPLACLSRQKADYPGEPLFLVGSVNAGAGLLREIAEITGQPVQFIDPGGVERLAAGEADPAADLIHGELPLGSSGSHIVIAADAGNVRRDRRDLLTAFAGLFPMTLLLAFLVGVLLAEGVARPVRALADRADEVTARLEPFLLLDRERNEVRRLDQSLERMLEAWSSSEARRTQAERTATWQEVARRIAHEVKNPLSPIKLAVENLRRTYHKAPAQFERALNDETTTILEEVDNLRRLVDEFSQFARMPAPQPTAVDPGVIVEQALALFAAQIDNLGAEVTIDAPATPALIQADPEQLSRVIKNILANALSALEPVDQRRIRIGLAQQGEAPWGSLTLEIQDSGIGLEPEAQRRIFEPYFTTRSGRGGTGLGMAISARIVHDHGGTIEAKGAPGLGTTITIRLPLAGPPPILA